MNVKTVNPVWIRAAQSMNADRMTIFATVAPPGSPPMILSGMRIGLTRAWQAWRAGGGAEASGGVRRGLSTGIFDAQRRLGIAAMPRRRRHEGRPRAGLGVFGFSRNNPLPAGREPSRDPLGDDGGDGGAGEINPAPADAARPADEGRGRARANKKPRGLSPPGFSFRCPR